MANYCKCGSITDFRVCSNKHCLETDRDNTDWIIDGKLVRFREAVTLARAVELMAQKSPLIIKPPTPIRENQYSIWINSTTW